MYFGATEINKSRTDDWSRTEPMNWRMTPNPPVIETLPLSGLMSPQIIRINVVFPEPFGPIKATFAPSPTRKLTSLRSSRPSDNAYSTAETSM
jgi:hypothetical protein